MAMELINAMLKGLAVEDLRGWAVNRRVKLTPNRRPILTPRWQKNILPYDRWSLSVPQAPALVAGFDDVAMMGQPIQERRCHLGVTEDLSPLPKIEIGGHQD